MQVVASMNTENLPLGAYAPMCIIVGPKTTLLTSRHHYAGEYIVAPSTS